MGMLERKLGFLAHNWFKILMALLALAGAILVLIELITVSNVLSQSSLIPADAENPLLTADARVAGMTSSLWFDIGLLIGLVAILVALVLSMFGKKKFAGYSFGIGGLIALVIFIVALAISMPYLSALSDTINASKTTYDGAVQALAAGAPGVTQEMVNGAYLQWQSAILSYQQAIFSNVINIFVFALLPLFFGIKKICKACCKKEAEAPTAK